MKVKYFHPDGTDEIVEIPDDAPQPADHESQDMTPIYDAALVRQAWAGVGIFLVLVVTIVLLGLHVYRSTRGC